MKPDDRRQAPVLHRRLRLFIGFIVVAGSAVASLSHASAAFQWHVVTLPPPAAGAFSFAEPGIAMRSDGSAMVAAATANTGDPATYWTSQDGGATWATGQSLDSAAPSTGDADVALGADGYRYALDLGYNPNPPGQPANPTVFVFRSPDGISWQGPASFPPPHGSDQPDRPWLFVSPTNPADVYVVNSEVGGNIVLWRSQDHAATFSSPITVSGGPNSQAALALSSRPLFDPTNPQRIFMLYETVTAAGLASTLAATPPVYEFPMTQVWLASSNDAGAGWSNSLVLDTTTLTGSPLRNGTVGHLLVASAVDGRGNLYAAFALRLSGDTRTNIYVIRSSDDGITWSAPSEVMTTSMQSNVMPALAASADGTVFLSWYGSPSADYRSADATWFEMFAESSGPLATSTGFLIDQLSTAPVHAGGIDTAGNIGANLGDNWGLKDFQGIAVDACGQPHPVWAVDDGTHTTQEAVPLTPCASQAGLPEAPPVPAMLISGVLGALIVWAGRGQMRRPAVRSLSRRFESDAKPRRDS
jgi:hypothetical protein